MRVERLSVCANPIIIWSSAKCILGCTSSYRKQGGPWIIYSIERFTTVRASQASFIFTVWFTCHFLLEKNWKSIGSAFAFIFTLPQSWDTDKEYLQLPFLLTTSTYVSYSSKVFCFVFLVQNIVAEVVYGESLQLDDVWLQSQNSHLSKA